MKKPDYLTCERTVNLKRCSTIQIKLCFFCVLMAKALVCLKGRYWESQADMVERTILELDFEGQF